MIARDDEKRVIEFAECRDLRHEFAYLAVKSLNLEVVIRDVAAHFGRIGIVRIKVNLGEVHA